MLVGKVGKSCPMLSEADIQILCGYVALEDMGGPKVPFCFGRKDFTREEAVQRNGPSGCPFGDGKFNPKGSRLPAADLGPDPNHSSSREPQVREAPTIRAVRSTFQRMGLSDRETVLLIVLGHQFGRCHPEVSGYEHPWYVFDPMHWNVYENGLGYLSAYTMGRYVEETNSVGKRQFNMSLGGGEPFMMLISDMVLLWDDDFREHLLYYDRHRREFRKDAAAAWKKLTELGCSNLRREQ